jgi:hypothetical protein
LGELGGGAERVLVLILSLDGIFLR